MAKNMARLDNGTVVNIEWRSDLTTESDILKNVDGRCVKIGDTYSDGYFWRNGERVLSEVEELRMANEILLNGLEVAK